MANIANEIAVEKLSEATVGYRENKEIAEKWVQLFTTPYFIVTAVSATNMLLFFGKIRLYELVDCSIAATGIVYSNFIL